MVQQKESAADGRSDRREPEGARKLGEAIAQPPCGAGKGQSR
jgi:hypothetical protein